MRDAPRQNFKMPKAEQSLTYCRKLKHKPLKTPVTLVSISTMLEGRNTKITFFFKFQRRTAIIPEYCNQPNQELNVRLELRYLQVGMISKKTKTKTKTKTQKTKQKTKQLSLEVSMFSCCQPFPMLAFAYITYQATGHFSIFQPNSCVHSGTAFCSRQQGAVFAP